jgi:hypothetical protein
LHVFFPDHEWEQLCGDFESHALRIDLTVRTGIQPILTLRRHAVAVAGARSSSSGEVATNLFAAADLASLIIIVVVVAAVAEHGAEVHRRVEVRG